MTTLSIVIVSYNTRIDLERCLRSLTMSPPLIPHEIIVVDNQSGDGSPEMVRGYTGVRLIETGSNPGYAAANNIGIRAGAGSHVLLLNSDTIVPPGSIDALAGVLVAHPDAAVVGPRLVNGAGQAELSFGPMLSPLAEMRQRRLVRGQARGDEAAQRAIEAMTRTERWVDWVSGACLLVPREKAEAVGLLDERYFLYEEDVDFCAAIRAAGGRILFTPAAEVVHLRGRSSAGASAAAQDAYRASHLAFYRKHHPWLAPLLSVYLRLKAGRAGGAG